MRVDQFIRPELDSAARVAALAERRGYDGVWLSETGHDPFLAASLAVAETSRISVGTGVAIAFARSPMITAHVGWDLQSYSNGRFLLGLGSQIKPHIERRYSMPWSRPVARMREYVAALHAIWDAWEDGSRLSFRGDFYTHTLMTPMFSPGASEFGRPSLLLAAVGPVMLRLAGEVADGLMVHPFTTARYLREITLPALDEGLTASRRARSALSVVAMPIVVTGATAEQREKSAIQARERLAFYGSTPAYRAVLELHGWGELQADLHALSRRGEWKAMGDLIDDEMLQTLAVVAEPDQLATRIVERFGGVADRVALDTLTVTELDVGAEGGLAGQIRALSPLP